MSATVSSPHIQAKQEAVFFLILFVAETHPKSNNNFFSESSVASRLSNRYANYLIFNFK